MSGGIWNGIKDVQEEAELKRDCAYCGYCGTRMREILHPAPTFDRRTGKQGMVGTMYWECPKRGIGLEAMHGTWLRDYEDNPHDSAMLRKVTNSPETIA